MLGNNISQLPGEIPKYIAENPGSSKRDNIEQGNSYNFERKTVDFRHRIVTLGDLGFSNHNCAPVDSYFNTWSHPDAILG